MGNGKRNAQIVLSKTVVKRIKAYHDYHGDSNIQVVKVIKDDEGYDAVVVRVNGNVSCLDLMDGDGWEARKGIVTPGTKKG